MKRIALFSIAIVVVLVGSACERFPAAQLPEHYQHKLHASAAHAPAAGEAHKVEAPKH